MSDRSIILIGGGGHCRSVIEAAESAGVSIAGILDACDMHGKEISGYRVTGTDEDIPVLAGDHDFIITVGQIESPDIRRRIAERMEKANGRPSVIIASGAIVSRHASVGEGTVVLHHALVNSGARIGRHCIINSGAIIEHDVETGDFCHISTGVIINGQCRIGAGTFIGSGSVVRNGITICAGSVIGAGSVVVHDITEAGVYYGNPAQRHS